MAYKKYTQADLDHFKKEVSPYEDEQGWFPDDILGDDIMILSFGEKKMVEEKLYWRIVKHKI